MKRLAIFAGYDKHGIVDDYVLYYLKELKKVADIVFVYDTEFSDKELKKVKDLTIHQICEKHGEYDFGSYKRGYVWAKENNVLEEYDQLIFCNDSVYGPFNSLENMFNKMARKKYDFWGPFVFDFGKNKKHIQSFFVVYNKNVFTSKIFNDFVYGIKKQESKSQIIKQYEIGGTRILFNNGFKFGGMFESDINKTHNFQTFILIKRGFPFLKINMFKQSLTKRVTPMTDSSDTEALDRYIIKHLKRVTSEDIFNLIQSLRFYRIHYNILHRKFIKIRARYTDKYNYKITISFLGVSFIVIVIPNRFAVKKSGLIQA